MPLDSQALLDKLETQALQIGYFDKVNMHEPKKPPGHELTAAIWVQHIGRATSSGASSTSAYVIFNIRIYANMLQEPQQGIDPQVMIATDVLMNKFQGNFTLDGLVRAVDLLGIEGEKLEANAGYVTINSVMFRTMDITVPLIINDVWDQVA